MDVREIISHIDHTLLKAAATAEEISALCREAIEYKAASVCIPPFYVEYARKNFPALNICTVAGFPLGYCTTAVKAAETEEMLKNGADEVDMVINLAMVKNGDFGSVRDEIKTLKGVCGGKILKVIVETCYLDENEKIRLCECVTEAGADFIKTSTGFGTAGADIADIRLFKRHIGENVKIKAAGGIRTREAMEMFLNEGCERIGTSSMKILI